MSAGAMSITGMITPVDARGSVRRSVAGITPEFYFHKTIDNSRVIKVADPRRKREIRMFSASVAALFLFVLFYAWQHFSSIEYGYRIEAQKAERERLVEVNRTLTLETASLRDPGRIDALARKMGLESTQPGQVIRLNPEDVGAPIVAQATTVAVITTQ